MGPLLRHYAVTLDESTEGSLKIPFLPYKAGTNVFATSSDWTPGAGDFKLSKKVDGSAWGAEASIGTAPTWVNGRVVIILSGTELTAQAVSIRIENAAINSDVLLIETFGNASASWPTDYTTFVAQSGDSYAIANSGTYGNSALKTLLDAITGYIDTEVAAIKAKTDNLPSDPADASDIAGSFSAVNATLATIAAYIDTEVGAIKTKTDNLPSDPADASDIAGAFSTVNSTLSTIAAYIDTEVAAIKAKTDQLTFTVAGIVDANAAKWNSKRLP